QVVHEVTEEFTAISAAIIAIIESLSEEESQQQPCVNFMSSVQNEEKEKLELVVRLQLLKQCVLDNEGSLKMQYEDEERQLKLRVSALEERIAEHIEELRYEIANE
ncbi:PREDICTED: uncharacterized protein C19orf60 homolog, partial [Priapulus caudatus]|uniref:Uncharacterized protein C19orf60 homolog n=1 Tax=Priapulus caudatus TaxID=37621 RepID=A0ABM1EX18_PRICU